MATPPASYGYPKASITADKLPIWQQPLSRYSVAGINDWKVSSLASIDRGIRVEAGTGSGDGVTDQTFEYETMSLPSPPIASAWYLIARRRNWSGTGTSTLVAIRGTATKALPTPGTGSANRRDAPGTESDQPLALVRVTQKDSTAQEIIDLRCWASNGGVEVVDQLALSYLETPGAAVKLGPTVWRYEPQGNGVWGWSGSNGATLSGSTGWEVQGDVTREVASTAGANRYRMGMKLKRTAGTLTMSRAAGWTRLTGSVLPSGSRPAQAVDVAVSLSEGVNDHGGFGILRVEPGGQVAYLPLQPTSQSIRKGSYFNIVAEWVG